MSSAPQPSVEESTQPSRPPVSRLCYLGGGLTALDVPGSKIVISPLNGPRLVEIVDPIFERLFATLTDLGLLVVGCEFFANIEEVQGLRPAEFRSHTTHRGWVAYETWEKWRQIAVTAMRADRLDVGDGAARIAFEIQAIEHRLLELSRAYSNQLRRLVVRNELKEYKRFDDLNSGAVIHCIHALFYELCVFRDYLAEFIGNYILGIKNRKGEPLRKMSGLRSRLVDLSIDDPLCREIINVTDPKAEQPGWLAVLSAYRNVFTHIAPMEHVTTRAFAIQEYVHLKGGRLPILYHPLPANALELERTRSNGLPFDRFEDWAKASVGQRPDRTNQPDALEYIHAAVNRMADLAGRLIARSPIAPKPMHIAPADMIGPLIINGGGGAI